MQRLARESGAKINEEATKGAAELRNVGEALAVKLEQDGAALVENLRSGDEATSTQFAELLSEAEQALTDSFQQTVDTLDGNETELVLQVQQVGEALLRAVDEVEAEQVAGIEASRDEVLRSAETAVQRAVDGLDDQIRQVETWTASVGAEQQDEAIVTLCDLTQLVCSQGSAAEGELGGIEGQAVAKLGQDAEQAALSIEQGKQTVDQQIDQVVNTARDGIQGVIDGLDAALGQQVQEFITGFEGERDEKIANLDEARDEAVTKLDETSAQGCEGIAKQQRDATEALTRAKTEATSGMSTEADRIANQSWWGRVGSAIGSFFGGLLTAIVDFVKLLGIVLLVVLAVVLVIALVILIVKGAAVLAAVAAAVAAFLVAKAAIIVAIAAVITAIGIIFALVSVAAAWMNPELTTDEKCRASGKGVGDILMEFLPDWGIGTLIKRLGKGGRILGSADEVGDLARTADNVDNPGNLAGKTDDLVPGSSAVPPGVVDDLAPPGSAVAPLEDASRAFDQAKAAGYSGDLDVFRRQWERGLRFDMDSRRWVRPPEVAPPSANANTSRAFTEAQGQGYGGKLDTFRANFEKGLRFDPETRRWSRPAPEAPVQPAPPPVQQAPAPPSGPTGPTHRQQVAQSSYTTLKGVIASGYAAGQNAGPAHDNVERMRGNQAW